MINIKTITKIDKTINYINNGEEYIFFSMSSFCDYVDELVKMTISNKNYTKEVGKNSIILANVEYNGNKICSYTFDIYQYTRRNSHFIRNSIMSDIRVIINELLKVME